MRAQCKESPNGSKSVNSVLRIVNVDRAVWVIQPPSDDLEGVTELPCPFVSRPSTLVEGALSEMEESVQTTPNPLKGKDASSKHRLKVRSLGRNHLWPLLR